MHLLFKAVENALFPLSIWYLLFFIVLARAEAAQSISSELYFVNFEPIDVVENQVLPYSHKGFNSW